MKRRQYEIFVIHSFRKTGMGFAVDRDFVATDFSDHFITFTVERREIEATSCPHCTKVLTEKSVYYDIWYYTHRRDSGYDGEEPPTYVLHDPKEISELDILATTQDPETILDWLGQTTGANLRECDPFPLDPSDQEQASFWNDKLNEIRENKRFLETHEKRFVEYVFSKLDNAKYNYISVYSYDNAIVVPILEKHKGKRGHILTKFLDNIQGEPLVCNTGTS